MIVIKILILLAMWPSFRSEETVQPVVHAYIDEYKYLAIDEMIRTGIPASVTIAQAIIESNAGVSRLARETNNHFGIKCKSYWEGSAYYHPDDDRDAYGNLIPSCFRKYDSVTHSYLDHSEFLMNTDHYQILFAYDKIDYEMWATGLEACGYATDKLYAEKLIRTIELYELHELDYYTIEYVERSKLSPKKDYEISTH